jgi:predicted dehydrogenase
MRKLRWGVISTGNIGRTKVVPAIQRGQHSDVVALASRDLARGRAAAAALGIPGVFGSYDALLADPGIEAVYICTPMLPVLMTPQRTFLMSVFLTNRRPCRACAAE